MSVDKVNLYSTSDLHFVFLNSCDPGWWHGALFKIGTFQELSKDESWNGRIKPIADIRGNLAEERATHDRQMRDIE